MRKAHLKATKEKRTETLRGRLSPTEKASVRAAQKDLGLESVSDLLMAGLEALAVLRALPINEPVPGGEQFVASAEGEDEDVDSETSE